MPILHLIAYFAAGALLTNAIPHFVHGVSGRPFQTPFAKPPGKGLSSSMANVLWGFANLLIGYLLLFNSGTFDPHSFTDSGALGLGVLLVGQMLARTFGKLHGGELLSQAD
jgi:hypothetical protein